MKKMIALAAAFLVVGSFTVQAQQADKKPVKSPRVTSSSDYATISYGQPSKNGREIFGKLVPYGEIWRTGANMSTDVTFTKDVELDGKKIEKGTYSLFTIPTDIAWMVMFNAVPEQRGASEYDDNKSKDVAKFRVPVEKTDAVVEKLTITPEKEGITISWDQTKVLIPVKVL